MAAGEEAYGYIGAVWPSKPTGEGLEYKEIFRCVSGDRDHFVTYASDNCEGTRKEVSLGWLAQSQPRLVTYINREGVHTYTSRSVTSAAGVPAGTVGFLMARPGADRLAVYSCEKTSGNKPWFLSTNQGCGGQRLIGIEGWVWSSPGNNPSLPRAEMRVCERTLANGKVDYAVELAPATCGQRLGYIDQTQPGFDQFYDPNGNRHWQSTRGVPAQYQFLRRLGYLYQSSADGRVALYSCLNGEQQFVSHDPSCDGKRVEGILGWVYKDRGEHRLELFACSTGRDRFVWTNSGCDGKTFEEELGWDSDTPPA